MEEIFVKNEESYTFVFTFRYDKYYLRYSSLQNSLLQKRVFKIVILYTSSARVFFLCVALSIVWHALPTLKFCAQSPCLGKAILIPDYSVSIYFYLMRWVVSHLICFFFNFRLRRYYEFCDVDIDYILWKLENNRLFIYS